MRLELLLVVLIDAKFGQLKLSFLVLSQQRNLLLFPLELCFELLNHGILILLQI